MTKLKVWKDFLKKKYKELKKVEHEIVNDFIVSDFQVINDTTLGGYVVRDGPYQYGVNEYGEPIVKYKDWNNLKEAYGNLGKVVGYGSKYQDSHYEADNRMTGYWDSFTLVPKGTKGPTKPYVDEKYNRVWAKQHTNKDITELSDLDLKDLKNLPVSSSYDDLGDDEIQRVGKIHHIATSLNKNEQDRCSTMDGSSCNVSVMDTVHDHSLIEVESATDSDINKGVLRADFSQPPKKKNKKEKAMGKDKKDKDAKEEDDEEIEEDTVETDVADGENKIMTGGEKKYPKGKVDGDDPQVEEKIKGSPYQENQKIGAKSKDMIELDVVKDMIAEAVKQATEDAMKPFKEAKDAKKANDFRETLVKEPYGFSEDYLKDKSLTKLKEIKEDFEQSKAYKDFVEKAEDFGISDVNKSLFDEGVQHKNTMVDFIGKSQDQYWAWADPKKRSDFFKEGV
jgi:hypothetical protein